MKPREKSEKVYGEVLDILLKNKIPFMIGGTYALTVYTGIKRKTKDMDILTTPEDYPRILKAMSENGFTTLLHDQFNETNWLAKVIKDGMYTDIIYSEKNDLVKVDKSWFKRSANGEVYNRKVKIVPIEELIRSKAYIQNKERFDGADINHLVLKASERIDWKFLRERMEPNWEILFGHLINFLFVYPNEKGNIPDWLIEDYAKRLKKAFGKKPDQENKLTRGLLISSQYAVAVKKWGYKPVSPFFDNLYEER